MSLLVSDLGDRNMNIATVKFVSTAQMRVPTRAHHWDQTLDTGELELHKFLFATKQENVSQKCDGNDVVVVNSIVI